MLGCRQAVRHWILIPASVGSNPATPAKKSRSSERDFFIQADRLGISSRFSVYLITPLGVHKKSVGLMICNFFEIDDIQCFALISNAPVGSNPHRNFQSASFRYLLFYLCFLFLLNIIFGLFLHKKRTCFG